MSLQAGTINLLTVVRKTEIAYLLKNELDEEVFLHVNETNHHVLEPNMQIEAFLYYDAKGRLSATLSTPLITINKPAILKVVGINQGLGVFLDMGVAKDLLLSKDYLPFDSNLWPRLGDEINVKLEVKNRLVARPLALDELPSIIGNLNVGEEVSGFVQIIGKIGIFVYTETGNVILIKQANLRDKYHLGQIVNLRVTYQTAIGYEGTLIGNKEVVRLDDASMVLEYLKKHNGIMPYTAETDSETISEVFSLSRKAFKRAIGHLYKERIVYFSDGNTYLKGDENESK